jgi:molybdopterin-synthase adenylyltransferase
MDDDHLMRYKRHLMLPQLDMAGQEKLLAANVLVIGAGGLGSPVLLYLAAAGVGHLNVYDPDVVEISNLQRQILHDGSKLGRPKTESAQEQLAAINPDVIVTSNSVRLEGDDLQEQVAAADLVIDCSDNFSTRFEVNRACVAHSRPLVSGAVIRLEGQVSVFKGHLADAPCYRCLYQEDEYNDETCTSSGVLGPVVGIIGSIQATEAIKLITGIGDDLCGRLLLLDAASMRFNEIRLKKDPACPVCSGRPG